MELALSVAVPMLLQLCHVIWCNLTKRFTFKIV